MTHSAYKIYNASAGSGKTFTLVKDYLKVILASDHQQKFRQILAITFTNKAVNEMKQRILESLAEISKSTPGEEVSDMGRCLLDELALDPATLQKRARFQLQHILHNYAYFDVSTIDKFTHRIIRSFAKDLNIAQNFEVILDPSLLIEEAVHNLLAHAGDDPLLTETLVNFALEKTDDERHWDLGYDLQKVGGMIFRENDMLHIKQLESRHISDFERLRALLRAEISQLEATAVTKAEKAMETISGYGLKAEDFPNRTLPNHFLRIISLEWDPEILYGNKLETNLKNGKMLKSAVQIPDEEIPGLILNRYLEIKNIIFRCLFLRNAYRNLLPLTLINSLNAEIKILEQERDLLPISSFNKIISESIAGEPAPFIYERIGEKYRHFFIDEFQDTSRLQWQNLIPLVSNALESVDADGKTGSLLIVGDVKQAIYRWRGGEPEQLLNLIDPSRNPFVIGPEVQTLETNYRSAEEIVRFNNAFFKSSSVYLDKASYSRLFSEETQQNNHLRTKGYVQLDFLEGEGEELDLLYLEQIIKLIRKSVEKGYSYSEICVLTRKKSHGTLISKKLIELGIPLVSTDTLLLRSSRKILFLIDLLVLAVYPEDRETEFNVLEFLIPKDEDFHLTLVSALKNSPGWLLDDWGFDLERLRHRSLYDGLEDAIRSFGLAGESDAFIAYFLDEVLSLEQRNLSGIQAFLDHWDKNSEKLSLSAPDDMDAVKIMTIHKAKGLEFPVVIFPYANSKILDAREPKIWLEVDPDNFSGFRELLLSKKKEIQQYSEEAAEKFREDNQKMELDAYNILYVALTRAVDALFVITEKDLDAKGDHKMGRYSGLFIQFLKEIGQWSDLHPVYSFGSLSARTTVPEPKRVKESIPFTLTKKEEAGPRMIVKSNVLWDDKRARALERGTLLHLIMSKIISVKDFGDSMAELIEEGLVSDLEKKLLSDQVHSIVEHRELSRYFRPGLRVKTEEEIISKNGLILRPDRLVFEHDLVTVIDYKTGAPSPAHRDQISLYGTALSQMGYRVENKILVYIDKKLKIEYI